MEQVRSERLSRRAREKERHRCEILEAAERVFVRKGYHLATVEEVAKEAEFAVGTIYNFFRNKEDLYWCVVLKIAQDFIGSFEQDVLSKGDPEEAIASLIRLRLKHFENHRGFFRVFLETSPASRLDPERMLPAECASLHQHYIERVNGIFARGVEEGIFDEIEPLYLTLCLEGIVNAFVAHWSKHEPTEALAARERKLAHLFLGRIRSGSSRSTKRPRRKA